MNCQNCGFQNPDNATICSNCGAALNNAAPVQAPVVNAAPVQEPVYNAAPVQEPVYNAAPVQEPVYNAAPVQEPVNNAPAEEQPKTPGQTLGLIGMILGIASLCFCNILTFNIVPIAGLVLSILGMKKDKEVGVENSKAKIGIILSAIGLALGVIIILVGFIGGIFAADL